MFAFDGNTGNENLPHNFEENNIVVYTGTHDNDTVVGYFRDKTEYELAYLYEYLNIGSKEEIPERLNPSGLFKHSGCGNYSDAGYFTAWQ